MIDTKSISFITDIVVYGGMNRIHDLGGHLEQFIESLFRLIKIVYENEVIMLIVYENNL